MAAGRRRRMLLVALVVAAAVGFLAGWFARIWYLPSSGSRARDALEGMRERARELTR